MRRVLGLGEHTQTKTNRRPSPNTPTRTEADARVGLPVLDERVVVRGEERAALELLDQELHHGMRDGGAVEGGGAWGGGCVMELELRCRFVPSFVPPRQIHTRKHKKKPKNNPSLPRPSSSRMTRERGVAWPRMLAVSASSTKKVDCPCRIRSEAPTLVFGNCRGCGECRGLVCGVCGWVGSRSIS